MCGILLALFPANDDDDDDDAPPPGTDEREQLFKERLQMLQHRGPDGSGTMRMCGCRVLLGHRRLAIVGTQELGAQPMSEKGVALVCNGELYGSSSPLADPPPPLPSGQGESDCKIILQLWLASRGRCCEEPDHLLRGLDGEYAFALVDEEHGRLLLARDRLGVKPLFVGIEGCGALWVSSTLLALPPSCSDAIEVPPGGYLSLDIMAEAPLATLPSPRLYWTLQEDCSTTFRYTTIDAAAQAVKDKLTAAVIKRMSHTEQSRVACLLSGGLDSSIVAGIMVAAAGADAAPVRAYTVSVADEHPSGDLHAARTLRDSLHLDLQECTFTVEEGIRMLEDTVHHVETYDVPTIRAAIPLLILARFISGKGDKAVLVGEGADELFCGYKRFSSYVSHAHRDEMHRECHRSVEGLHSSELLRVDRACMAFGVEARVPYLDPAVVEEAMSIDPALKMHNLELHSISSAKDSGREMLEKKLLRFAFRDLGLPEHVMLRPKVQFADGVGERWLSALHNHTLSRAVQCSLVAAASLVSCSPLQVEELVYRRIFHQSHAGSSMAKAGVVLLRHEDRRQRREALGLPPVEICTPSSTTNEETSQPRRPIQQHLDRGRLTLSREEATAFVNSLGLMCPNEPSLPWLDQLVEAFIRQIPFHNLTMLTRPRRPPTPAEIKRDVECKLGGPCAVTNIYLQALLTAIGYPCYLVACSIAGRPDCHAAVVVDMSNFSGLPTAPVLMGTSGEAMSPTHDANRATSEQRYFVDVGNAAPYFQSLPLGNSASSATPQSFYYSSLHFRLLRIDEEADAITGSSSSSIATYQLQHWWDGQTDWSTGLTFSDQPRTPEFFTEMIKESRTQPGKHNPFLLSLRMCSYKSGNKLSIRDSSLVRSCDRLVVPTDKALMKLVGEHFPRLLPLLPQALKALDHAGAPVFRTGNPPVFALVAACGRWELLFKRSLPSILKQTYLPCHILVIVDCGLSCEDELGAILASEGLAQADDGSWGWQDPSPRSPKEPQIWFTLNRRRQKSASGAWNTGLAAIRGMVTQAEGIWVAVLDDDDEWDQKHLEACVAALMGDKTDATSCRKDVHMVVSGLRRCSATDDAAPEELLPSAEFLDQLASGVAALSPHDFLVGNPGVQGSNLFVTLEALMAAGGFDEALPSCTDRDLMIRLLELPWLRIAASPTHTVKHHVDPSMQRLSNPGSEKRKALGIFWRKHCNRMTANEQGQYRARCRNLFGCSVPAPAAGLDDVGQIVSSADTNGDVPISPEVPTGNGLPPVYLTRSPMPCAVLIGVVATSSPVPVLQSLARLQAKEEVEYMDVIVLDNGGAGSRELEAAQASGLRCAVVSLPQQKADASFGLFGAGLAATGIPSSGPRPAALTRTMLQHYLFHFAKFQGLESHSRYLVWILDEDKDVTQAIFASRTADGGRKLGECQVEHLLTAAYAVHEQHGASVVLGQDTGSAPLPALCTLRTQMVDLVANLQLLAHMSPHDVVPDQSMENLGAALEDQRHIDGYYHDLSQDCFDHLESPWWLPPSNASETAEEMFCRIAHGIESVFCGQQLFRPLFALEPGSEEDALLASPSTRRGGNTFVFDLEALLVPNMLVPLDELSCRRSDFIWAMLNQQMGRKVVHARALAVRHVRDAPCDVEAEEWKMKQDLVGFATYSALVQSLTCSDSTVPLDASSRDQLFAEKAFAARAMQYTFSLHRVFGCIDVALNVLEQPGAWWQGTESFQTLCSHLRLWKERARRMLQADWISEAPPAPTKILHAFNQKITSAASSLAPCASPPPESTLGLLGEIRVTLARCSLSASPGGGGGAAAAAAALLWQNPAACSELELVGSGGEGVTFRLARSTGKEHDSYSAGDIAIKVMDRYLLRREPYHLTFLQDVHRRRGDFRCIAPIIGLYTGNGSLLVQRSFQHGIIPCSGDYRYVWRSALELLHECQVQGVVLTNMTPSNFVLRHHDSALIYIDTGLDMKPYDHAEWLAMGRQMFCLLFWSWRPDIHELLMSARGSTAPDSPEFAGLSHFMQGLEQWVSLRSSARPQADRAAEPLEAQLWQHKQSSIGAEGESFVMTTPNVFLEETPRFRRLLQDFRSCGLIPVAISSSESVSRPGCSTLLGCTDGSSLQVTVQQGQQPAGGQTVALLIRTCYWEHSTIIQTARHLQMQLEGPHTFNSRLLLCDCLNSSSSATHPEEADMERFRKAAEQLLQDGTITDVIYSGCRPGTDSEQLNLCWLGVSTDQTHSEGRRACPLTATFEGLDAVAALQEDLCLLVDSDMLVARLESPRDPFLQEMVEFLQIEPNLLAVALPSPAPSGTRLPWHCHKLEVRGALIDLKRLFRLLPMPLSGTSDDGGSHFVDGKVHVGWNRLVDEAAHGAGLAFGRWGTPGTFVLHPDCRLKADPAAWMLLLDGVEHGRIPSTETLQQLLATLAKHPGRTFSLPEKCENHFLPSPRNEPVLLVVYSRCSDHPRLLKRCVSQIRLQALESWGCVLVVDGECEDPSTEVGDFADAECGPDSRFTVIRARAPLGRLGALSMVLRQICANQDAIVVPMDAQEVLLGPATISTIAEAYNVADCAADATTGEVLPGCPSEMEARSNRRGPSLQSFRVGLFLRLKEEDLQDSTDFTHNTPAYDALPYSQLVLGMATRIVHISLPVMLWDQPALPIATDDCGNLQRPPIIYPKHSISVAVVGSANLGSLGEKASAVAGFAEAVGQELAEAGFQLWCGGMGGVMEAACRGAKRVAGSITVGLLPGSSCGQANHFLDVVVPTSTGIGRNCLLAHADAVVAIAGGAGTLSEVGSAWQLGRPVIALRGFGWSGRLLADNKLDDRRNDCVHGVDIDNPHDVADIMLGLRLQLYEMKQQDVTIKLPPGEGGSPA